MFYNMMKCLKPAAYFVVDETDEETWHHMALNFGVYTHFTSPIRRYMDLVVHRMLTGFLLGVYPQDKIDLGTLKGNCDMANKKRKDGRSASDFAEEMFYFILTKKEPIVVEGMVNFICNQHIEVFCRELRGCAKIKMGKRYNMKLEGNDDEKVAFITLNKKEIEFQERADAKNEMAKNGKNKIKEKASEYFPKDGEGDLDENANGKSEGAKVKELKLRKCDLIKIRIKGTQSSPVEDDSEFVFE